MGCINCGASFKHVDKKYKYLKKPVGITIIVDVFQCTGEAKHIFTAIETQTLKETKMLRQLKEKELEDAGFIKKNLNKIKNQSTVPYNKRTDLGEPTEDEKRIAEKNKDLTLEQLKEMYSG